MKLPKNFLILALLFNAEQLMLKADTGCVDPVPLDREVIRNIPGWKDPNECLEWAVNYVWLLSHVTGARSWIASLQLFNEDSYQDRGHAMVFFIFQNNVYVADNNKLPTLITQQELGNIAWNQPFAEKDLANFALHKHWGRAENSWTVKKVEYLKGKQDVFDFFKRYANEQLSIVKHQYFFPLDWCQD